MRTRAFTLLEAMLALAISGVVVASATVATVSIYRTLVAKEQQAEADDQARAVVDYLASSLLTIGNDYVVPAAAVTNACWSSSASCVGDGLRHVQLDGSLPQVEIESVGATSGSARFPATVTIKAVGSACPLASYPSTAVNVLLLPGGGALGGGWRAARCTKNASGCGCALSAFTLVGTAPPTDAPHVGAATGTAFANVAAGWIMAPGDSVAVWFDSSTKTLFEARDFAGDGKFQTRPLSDSIRAFRVHFAFEGATAGVLDPWTFKPDPSLGTTLRAVRLGVIAEALAPSRTTPSTATLFAGEASAVTVTASTGALLRPASANVLFRNTLTYQ